jgi:ribosomal protein S1
MKTIIMVIIISLSLLLHSAYAIDEYTRIVGKVLSIDPKDSTIKVNVFSEVCNGLHRFDIENAEAIKKLKEGDTVALYILNDCKKAKIGE